MPQGYTEAAAEITDTPRKKKGEKKNKNPITALFKTQRYPERWNDEKKKKKLKCLENCQLSFRTKKES